MLATLLCRLSLRATSFDSLQERRIRVVDKDSRRNCNRLSTNLSYLMLPLPRAMVPNDVQVLYYFVGACVPNGMLAARGH